MTRRIIEKYTQTPTNWHWYPKIDQNKTKLFAFHLEKIMQVETNEIEGAAFKDKFCVCMMKTEGM